MPYFGALSDIYLCPRCKNYYRISAVKCGVEHSLGECCHAFEQKVQVVPDGKPVEDCHTIAVRYTGIVE